MFNEWGITPWNNKSVPFQGMLGNGARFLGPSAAGNATSSTNNQQHQSQFNRSLWPTATTFQANGEFTVPITDSSIFTSSFAPSPNTNNSHFLPTLPFELVKNWNTGAVAFSQANSSIFVQSHTADFINCTTSASVTTSAPQITASRPKAEANIGRWEHGSLIEPLQIHLPATPTITNYPTATAIKAENVSSGSSTSSNSSTTPKNSSKKSSKSAKHNKNINDCILNLHQQHHSKTTAGTSVSTKIDANGAAAGCSRTVPLTWNQAIAQFQQQANIASSNANCSTADTTSHTTATLLQIKREPCQVSEVTTSNNLLAAASFSGAPAIIKIEQKSPTTSSAAGATLASISSSIDTMSNGLQTGGQQNNGAAIPIGIAVGRQRLQETNQAAQQLQSKDLSRFGLGLADLGCTATPNLSQNMFFTGTTTIPLTDVMHQNHQSVAMTQNRTPPTLFQYPTMPMEIPALPPPVGFQLVRDPSTGQFLFLPTTTTIVTLDKINISCIEPIPQALVWPTYPQSNTQTSGLQPPHLLLPPLQQSLQPPPLALLGSDYLTASTTLHQSHLQHTSTHSTRLVALTSDTKRTKCTQQTTNVPLPLPAHTLIKIEDGHHHQNHHHHQASIYEQEKSIQTASIATVQAANDLNGQLFYQHPGLIQIAPQPPMAHQASIPALMDSTECRNQNSPPPLQLTTSHQQTHSTNSNDTCNQLSLNVPSACPPEVQDANIQTSPIMSEDDNTSGNDDMVGCNQTEYEYDSQDQHSPAEKPSAMEIEPEVTREEISEHRESVPDTSVTSSSLIVNIKQQIGSPDTSINESKDDDVPMEPSQSEEQREPVDLSGLQLLSNSIDVFQKKTIKQEPLEQLQITSPTIASTTITPPIQEPDNCQLEIPKIPKGIPEDLGGLNLLCALAEQRLEEDFNNQMQSPTVDDGEPTKKRKHKVKSSKKSKHKEERKAKKRKHSSCEEQDDDLKGEIADSLKRVKTKFDNLPISSVDDVFRLMESDMKEKLANITRQCEEKRRELKKIKPSEGGEKDSSSSSSEQNKPLKAAFVDNAAPLKFSIIPALSPSFSSSSNCESLVDIPKLSSDTDSGSKFDDGDASTAERSKRKFSIPNKNLGDKQGTETIVSKKNKNFVGYIMASKSKIPEPSALGSWTSSISKNGKASLPFVKQEEQEGRGILKESAFKDDRVFSIFGDGNHQKFEASSPLTLSSSSRHQQTFAKHHSKHKKHKDRKHREKKKIDNRCMLTLDHLKQEKTRVLTAQGGLFYAGTMNPVEPPDIYAITLDGERGNRPHIMTQEEILKDAILEVQPKSTSECPPGTRLCAYWSQQYRCLYPGVATVPSSPDSDIDEKYVNVEFDDGDNGRIVLEDIRFLHTDYPIVEYDPNPLQSLNKRKRQSSQGVSDHEKMPSNSTNVIESASSKNKERKRLKKMRKDKLRLQSSPDHAQDSFATTSTVLERKHKKKHKCQDDLCKHRKHKKRRKHKKHHHRELDEEDHQQLQHLSIVQNASVSNDSNNNEEEFDEESQGSMSLNESVTQYEIVKKVGEELVVKDDPDTMESSVTESSGSVYQPKKSTTDKLNKSNESNSKIAAFLPARQLWAWAGKGFKRSTGRIKKQFYKSIQRGKETISVGDSAVFLSTGRPDRPYIGHIESMWETANGHMVVRVKWFYHPEETQGCPNLKYPGALFESPHEDENDVQTISHKCEVLDLSAYVKKFGNDPKQYQSIYDNNDTYYLAGYYDPTLYQIKMESEIPVMPENEKWI